jgi:hypothetical protein
MYSVDSEIQKTTTETPKAPRFSQRRIGAAAVAGLLVIVGLATAWNLEGWPGRVDDDEGTYVAQAWAIIYQHTLTHYPYWYDHPPGGWIQIAAFAWITDGFNRVTDAVFVGRQFMVVVTLISCVLVYVLCRRLGLRQATSAVAVLLFGLSPIAQYYHRLVSLDNVETMWVLAALVAATSTRRGWGPACRTGACAAIAVLSKETALILVPVILWVLWQRDVEPDTAVAVAASDAAAADGGNVADTAELADTADPVESADDATVAGGSGTAWGTSPETSWGTTPYEASEATPRLATPHPAAPVGRVAEDGTEAPVWMPDWSAFASRHNGDLQRLRARLSSWPTRQPDSRPRSMGHRAAATSVATVTRPKSLAVFAVTLVLILLLYPIYALQRGEFSMLWSALKFQFLNRPGSGSLLDSGSYTYSLVHTWVTTDPWLLLGGFFAALFMLLSRRLRPFSVGLLLQIVILLHGGYLPFFYVTAVIPFAAVLLAGAADTLWAKIDVSRLGARAAHGAWRGVPYLGRAIVAVAALVAVVVVAPTWWNSLNTNSTANGDTPYLAAATWAEHNVPKNDTVVVDDYLWVDLKTHGLNPLWIWKISAQTAPSYKSIQYILLQPQSAGTLAGMPALQAAYAHSTLVKDFGNGLTVRRVNDGG